VTLVAKANLSKAPTRRSPRLMFSSTPSTSLSPSPLSSTKNSLPSKVATSLSSSTFLVTPQTLTTPSPSTPSTPPSRTPPSPLRSRTIKTTSPYPSSVLTIFLPCFPARRAMPLVRASRSLCSHSRIARLRGCGLMLRSSFMRRLPCCPRS